MLRTVCVRPTLWEALLPPEALVMPVELEAVDALLDAPRFFEPFCRFFDPTFGRPSIPMEADVSEVPVPAWLRDAVRRSFGLVDVVAVLSDPAR